MGTQQILLIVLSVIIVGAAIAVGIQMFNAQGYSANKTSIAAQMQIISTMIIQYNKMPRSLGGAGSRNERMTAIEMGRYIGWDYNNPTMYQDDYANYTLNDIDQNGEVIIIAYGKDVRKQMRPKVVTRVKFPDCDINTSISDVNINDIE